MWCDRSNGRLPKKGVSMADYNYDPVEVRRVILEIPTRLLDSINETNDQKKKEMEDNGDVFIKEVDGVTVDMRFIMAVQGLCFSAVGYLDSTVLEEREVKQMNLMFSTEDVPQDITE